MTVLVDKNNQPSFWLNAYISLEYASHSPDSREAVLRSLAQLELWSESQGFHASDRLAAGGHIGFEEQIDLAGFLKLKRPYQDELVAIGSGVRSRRVAKLESLRSNTKQKDEARYAGRTEAANRIRWVAAYQEWHLQRSVSRLNQDGRTQDALALDKAGTKAIEKLRKQAPRGGSYALNESLVGIDGELVKHITKVLKPANAHSDNPFTTPFLMARNYITWRMFADTGMRRSEFRHLKVDDVDWAGQRVSIRVSKTKPRTVPISAETSTAFRDFVIEHWGQLPPKATNHGYLFIAENGQWLAKGTVNDIFEKIRTIPGVPEWLAPHTMRRTWNEGFSAKIDAMPADKRPSVQQEEDMRNRLQGWADRSQMGARYAKRHIVKKADDIAEDLANSIGDDGESHE